MAEEPQKNKMGGWLRDLAGVFVVMDEETKPTTSTPPPSTSPTPSFAGKNSSTTINAPVFTPPASNDFVDDLRNRFRKILEEKIQPGFDF